ncbi:MAG: Universal stress protein family protein [Methanocella sp. PtaU1.Bin125]|nr:MAG: Universal stress protein family protein [Methanocella sp. PtaU1.Bin125]
MSILLAVDKNPNMDNVVKFAIDLAAWRHDEIYAVHIVTGKRGVENDRIIKDGLLLLDRIKDRAAAFGVFLTPMLESGSVYETILNAAIEKKADLIVVGSSSGKGHLEQDSRVGSVSEFIVHNAPCTVVVVK